MTPRAAVRAYLLGHAVVGPLLGGSQAANGVWQGRIYPKRLPQSPTLPAITVWRVSSRDGMAQRSRGPLIQRLQLNIFASTEAGAETLAEAVRDALHGESWWTTEGDQVQLVDHDNTAELPDDEDAATAPGTPLAGQRSDYIVHFRKAA